MFDKRWEVREGDCLDLLFDLPDNSVDAVVTDPPYELGFMGKRWDASGITYKVRLWKEVLRVLKPGGHLLAFGGTRTYHRLVCAIEDAGFEIRDSIHWIYGQGFPKSLDVSKAIDKAAGVEREVIGTRTVTRDFRPHKRNNWGNPEISAPKREVDVTTPATDDAKQWDGWGTALKPAHEPIVLARKPLSERNVADNVRKHGTGAINIDGCRIPTGNKRDRGDARETTKTKGDGPDRPRTHDPEAQSAHTQQSRENVERAEELGRFPANIVLSHHPDCVRVGTKRVQGNGIKPGTGQGARSVGFGETGKKQGGIQRYGDSDGMETVEDWKCVPGCPVAALNQQSGERPVARTRSTATGESIFRPGQGSYQRQGPIHQDSGAASRYFATFEPDYDVPFFYCAKASRKERNSGAENNHPTVKPIALMRWLCRLSTPPNGLILDPFCGSGSTGCAAVLEGFRFLGFELEPEYCEIARKRIAYWTGEDLPLFRQVQSTE